MFDQELWLSQGQKSHILKCESGAPISNDDNLIETEGQTNLGWFQQKFCIQKNGDCSDDETDKLH